MPAYSEETHLTIPSGYYIGLRASSGLMQACMAPEGSDAVSMRRKAKVDNWIQFYRARQHETPPTKVILNEPLVGFRLRATTGSHKDNGSVGWFVEDPRGFDVAITAYNATQLATGCSIINSEILDRCIWSTFGNHNILIPTASARYKNAVCNTGRMNQRVSLRSVKAGNHIVTVDGVSGVFLGTYYPLRLGWHIHNVEVGLTKKSIVAAPATDGIGYKTLRLFSSLKVSQITDKAEKTKSECLASLNSHVQSAEIDGYTFPTIVGFTSSAALQSDAGARLEPIEYNTIISRNGDCAVVAELGDGKFGLCHTYQIVSNNYNVLVRTYSHPPIGTNPSTSYGVIHVSKPDLKQLKLFCIRHLITTSEGFQIDVTY